MDYLDTVRNHVFGSKDEVSYTEDDMKCQEIFKDLLESQKASTNRFNSCNYVRKLFGAKKCDKFHSFKIPRMAYKSKMNKNDGSRMKRILESKESESDAIVAAEVCEYYQPWTKHELMAALKWDNWVYYRMKQVRESWNKLWESEL